MENKEKLEKEINELTDKLRKEKPAVYALLMESPRTVPNEQNKNSDNFDKALERYRNELVELLKIEDQ